MNKTEKVALTKYNIETAIRDYFRYTIQKTVQYNISKIFINNLANSSVAAKENLRNLFRKSPHWNENLDALVIDTNVVQESNCARISALVHKILRPAIASRNIYKASTIMLAMRYFTHTNSSFAARGCYIEAIEALAPKAYAPGKKPSRIFKALCVALGVADESVNSEFQKDFALLANELCPKTVPTRVYISLNPAHFLTMSNPKEDSRGDCLVSCHSLNDEKTDYNGGCIGYARDNVTMIVFTASDPNNLETLNNRKTTRQLFMYQPHNGLLLQSRMYNTRGGEESAQRDAELYRSLVEQEIAYCEHVTNTWHAEPYYHDGLDVHFESHPDFSGFPDWKCSTNTINMSINDNFKNKHQNFIIGNVGLCISCGKPTHQENGLYCTDCKIKQLQVAIA